MGSRPVANSGVEAAPDAKRPVPAEEPTEPTPARRSPGGSTAIIIGLLVAFLAAKVAIWLQGKVFTSADAASYAWRGGQGFDRGPLVSLTGHAPRLWGTPLFYAVLPNDTARALAQWALGTLAWALLAWVVWGCLRTLAVRVLAAAGLLALGILPEVSGWDFTILSEPLSVSLGVLTLALLLRWLSTGSRPALVALTFAAGWWTFVRPEVRLMVAFVAAVLAVRAWRDRGQRRPAMAAGAVLVIAMAWVTVITPTMTKTYAERSSNGLTLEESTLAYRLRMQVMRNPEIMAVYKDDLGMPDCPEAERIAGGRAWAMAPFIQAYLGCPDLVAWGKHNATSSGYRFALAAPLRYADNTVGVLPLALGGAVYGQRVDVLPTVVDKAAFPRRSSLVLPLLLGGLALAVVAAFVVGAHRRRRLLVATGVGLAAASLAGIVAELMYAAGEYSRFGIQEAIAIRLGLGLVAVAVLDTILERIRERRRPEASADAGP